MKTGMSMTNTISMNIKNLHFISGCKNMGLSVLRDFLSLNILRDASNNKASLGRMSRWILAMTEIKNFHHDHWEKFQTDADPIIDSATRLRSHFLNSMRQRIGGTIFAKCLTNSIPKRCSDIPMKGSQEMLLSWQRALAEIEAYLVESNQSDASRIVDEVLILREKILEAPNTDSL